MQQLNLGAEQARDSSLIRSSCRASYCEIYNEALYDLLKFSKQQLPVRWDAHRGFHAPDLMQRDCSTMADLTQVRASLTRGVSGMKMRP